MHTPEAGAGFLARRADVPIVPVGIYGAERVWPRGHRLPRRTEVRMVFGPAFRLPPGIKDNREAADFIMARVAELIPAPYRGVFGVAGDDPTNTVSE